MPLGTLISVLEVTRCRVVYDGRPACETWMNRMRLKSEPGGKNQQGRFAYTYGRELLDQALLESQEYMGGIVVDVGGKKERKRGRFRRPEERVEKWIYANIDSATRPDVLANAEALPFADRIADTVVCTGVFHALPHPDRALSEIHRILRQDGILIFSMPFFHPISPDPEYDLQRFTDQKLKRVFEEADFEILELRRLGFFFTVICDMLKVVFGEINFRPRWLAKVVRVVIGAVFFPVARLLVNMETRKVVKDSMLLTGYTRDLFILARKP